MARPDAFDAFHRELRTRLLHQTYAFCGDTDHSRDAVAEAFTAAAQHWRTVGHEADREAWVRRAAFAAARRGRAPQITGDGESASMLSALQRLTATQRHLVVATTLGGADAADAAREVGLTVPEAERQLETAYAALRDAGAAGDAQAVTASLDVLRADLQDESREPASALRRAGDRRRRTRTGLAALCGVAVVIAAGAVTAGGTFSSGGNQASGGPSSGPSAPATSSAPASSLPLPEVGAAELFDAGQLRQLDVGRRWKSAVTQTNPAAVADIDSCLSHSIDPDLPDLVWQREFTGAGANKGDEAYHVIVNAPDVAGGRALYAQLRDQLTTCPSRQVRSYYVVDGAGDQASELQLAYVDGDSIKASTIGLQRSGETVSLLLVRTDRDNAPDPRGLKKLIAWFNDQACPSTSGECNDLSTSVAEQNPPADPEAPGFLSAADIALLPGVAKPWAGTEPRPARTSGAATLCTTLDFQEAGAQDLTDRSYVIPDATKLPTLFGLTQTRATFPTAERGSAVVDRIERGVEACPQKYLSVELADDGSIDVGAKQSQAQWWTLNVRYEENRVLRVRTAVVRVGDRLTQLTFTPGDDSLDMTDREFRHLVKRAAVRLGQA